MKAEAQPEKNVITDLADFIYLINHRLVAYCCCCCLSLKTMGIVVIFYMCACPTPVGDDFMLPHIPKLSPLQNIHRREMFRCLCKHFSTQQKTSNVYRISSTHTHSFSRLCEWKCQQKSSTICCLNKQMKKRNNQVFEAHCCCCCAYGSCYCFGFYALHHFTFTFHSLLPLPLTFCFNGMHLKRAEVPFPTNHQLKWSRSFTCHCQPSAFRC